MGVCSPYDKTSYLYYIDENKLFSCITTFTFAVLGIFLYILRSYTFFEKYKIPRAIRPSAPYGNVKEILFQNTTMYIYLWKYYNKFKRKGFKFGGFYIFFKPCILAVHPSQTFKILSDEKGFEDLYHKKYVKDSKKVVKIFSDHILEQLIYISKDLKANFLEKIGESRPFTEVLHNFLIQSACSTFGFGKESKDILNGMIEEKNRSSFCHYLKLVLPLFERKKSNHELRKNIKDTYTLMEDEESEEIVQELIDIFVENVLHSYSTVVFCLYELASHREIQDDLIGEIRRFNKNNSTISLENLHHLIYLEAIVKETLRKYPPIPLVTKKPKKDQNMNDFGLNIPKNYLVFATIFGIHHDPLNYPDPESFDPDRFHEDNMKYIKPNTYVPFGMDWRRSICFRLTAVHIKLCIFNILSSFSVKLTNKEHTLEFDNHKTSTAPREPLPLQFVLLSD
ncbi:hypothetical protein JTB14_025728 [Gonioctena quinquepunctata]|nr:hypothetical protein JTB14_025728 [Gonioctena quinquepunctata]